MGIAYVHGVTENPSTGFGWFYKAALQGNPAAQHNLAGLYQSGNGTLKNEAASFDWSLKAALNREPSSQLSLCSRYQKPSSNEVDLTMAYAWCLISASENKPPKSLSHYSQTQSELLETYSAHAKEKLSPGELEEATTLATMWELGRHMAGVTLPKHSLHALALGTASSIFLEESMEPYKPAARQGVTIRSNGCETGHWVDSVLSDGAIVKLEDGTIWKVDDADTIDSSLCLDTDDITVCSGKLMNTDDRTSVGAHKVH